MGLIFVRFSSNVGLSGHSVLKRKNTISIHFMGDKLETESIINGSRIDEFKQTITEFEAQGKLLQEKMISLINEKESLFYQR